MTYQEADAKLQGRCHLRRQVARNTTLERRTGSLVLRLYETDLIEYFPDGRLILSSGGFRTMTTKERLNKFLPYGWGVNQALGHWFLKRWSDETGWKTTVSPYRCHYRPSWYAHKVTFDWLFEDGVTITPEGEVEGTAIDPRPVIEQRRTWDKERSRLRYYVRRAREHKPARTRLTVQAIMAEPNVSIRMAMAHAYGLERFLLDAGAKVIDSEAGYELLSFPMGEQPERVSERVVALKMTCPSTGAVYISPVEPWLNNVRVATDWYFDVPGYLDRIGEQT